MAFLVGAAATLTALVLGCLVWVTCHLLRQNGRMLLRLDALQERLEQISAPGPKSFGDRSLAGSRINRAGLTAGTRAPSFRLPRVDGGELSLDEYAGRRVLLVFSDPGCEPCNRLVPKLVRVSGHGANLAIIMVSRGGVDINRRHIAEYGVSFPVVLQAHWEISRLYAKFVTPIAYLIDEEGFIAANVAVGTASILQLLSSELCTDRSAAPSAHAGEMGRGADELPAATAV